MNAPAKIMVVREETGPEIEARRSIELRVPKQTDLAMASRVDILLMRDQAWAGMGRACPSAATLLCQAARIGTDWAYADADVRQLLKVRSAIRQTIDAARALERAQVDG